MSAQAKALRNQLCLESECIFDKGCGCLEAIDAMLGPKGAEIAKLQERCDAYKGQIEYGATEIAKLRAALWPFAMHHQIGAGYCEDDFRRASEAMGKE